MTKFPIFLAGGIFLLAGTALADSPREFLQQALQGDNSEMMLGRIAQQRGSSRSVRDYGAALVRDHAKARTEVLAVGRSFGLKAHNRPAPEAAEEQRKLSRMRGDEFDREFAHYMVEDHSRDIEKFRHEVAERHGKVSQVAERQLPVLERHLRMAQQIDHDADLAHSDSRRR